MNNVRCKLTRTNNFHESVVRKGQSSNEEVKKRKKDILRERERDILLEGRRGRTKRDWLGGEREKGMDEGGGKN